MTKTNDIIMKKILALIVFVNIGGTLLAQGKYGATPEDSIKCIESLIYKDYLKNDPALALSLWRTAYNTCPSSQKSLYINGVKLYKGLIKNSKDAAMQKAYKDTMYSIFDQRIEVFGQKGLVLGKKGQTMLVYSKKEPQKTFDVLNEAIALTGDKTESGTAVATMFAIINLEKNGLTTKEEVIKMFGKLSDICEKNVNHPKYGEKYVAAQEKIQDVTSPYLACDVLIPMAEKDFEKNKEDVNWLRRTVKLLKAKKCYEAAIFSQIAEAYFDKEPSADGAEGMGNLFLAKKEYTKAVDFFKKALDMVESDEDKAHHSYNVAQAYLYAKQYSQVRVYAQKAANAKAGWGEPYILIGDAYAYSTGVCDDGELGKWGVTWAAVDAYQKAKSIDASVSETANKKIARASGSYPTTKDIFFYGKADGDSYTVGCWINKATTIRTK